jgi:RHS repeat-associated protein
VVTANYIYHDLAKADNPITEIDYYANNALLGKLTYSYDTDGPIVGKGGSLATVNLPASTTAAATYNGDNTLLTWNGVSATDDDGQELTLDPSNSNSYDWNEYRSHSLRSIPPTTIPGACPEQSRRDALYRRESVDNYSVLTTFLYDALLGVEFTTGSTANGVLRLPGSGEVFAWTSGSSTMVPINDLLGSTVGLVSSTGSLATQFTGACPERSRGKPFGKPSPTTSAYPYLFAGMEYDNTTGLYHTQARYYSPVLQRFLSEDPLRHGAGVNFFSYGGNDPVNGADPSGLGGFYSFADGG